MRVHNTYGDVIRDFVSMADALNRMSDVRGYDYAAAGGHDGEQLERALRLPLDAWVDGDDFFIKAYLPGVDPEDVDITFEGEELTIRGHFPAVDPDTDYIKRELFHGPFERRLTFNVPVDVDGIKAVFENGLLMLTVPKAEAVRPKQIKIQTK